MIKRLADRLLTPARIGARKTDAKARLDRLYTAIESGVADSSDHP
ncbi:hypothetical protein [Aminobacter sp. AP02]|nr:hypothetical protein [Aminobacter sp. AP02]